MGLLKTIMKAIQVKMASYNIYATSIYWKQSQIKTRNKNGNIFNDKANSNVHTKIN